MDCLADKYVNYEVDFCENVGIIARNCNGACVAQVQYFVKGDYILMRELVTNTLETNSEMQFFINKWQHVIDNITFLLSKPSDCGLHRQTCDAMKVLLEPLNDMIFYAQMIQQKALDLQKLLQGQYVSIEELRAAFNRPRFFTVTSDGDFEEVSASEALDMSICDEAEYQQAREPVKRKLAKIQAIAETEAQMWADNLFSKRQHEAEQAEREQVGLWKQSEQL